MEKEEIKNVYEKLKKMLKELEEHSDADACPTFIPAPPELTNTFNRYLKESQSLCPEHDGIQLIDPLNEKSCQMGQLLRFSTVLSEFLEEELNK